MNLARSVVCRLWRHYTWEVGTKGIYCADCKVTRPRIRCALNLHHPEWFDPHESYDEPPDPWWHCGDCDKYLTGGNVWHRLQAWFWEHPRMEWFIEWDYRRHFDEKGNPR